MTWTEQSLPLPSEVRRGATHCRYGLRSLRRSRLLATSRPWQVVANHVARGELPATHARS